MRRLGLLFPAFLLAGCGFYFGGDDDPCPDYGGGGSLEPAPGQRNPETGVCESFGGGGSYPCDGVCGACPEPPPAETDQAQPSWGYCESHCTGLTEDGCLEAEGCRAIYVDPAPDGETLFAECWSTDLTGPVRGGECAGLDAYECSRHDDCVAIHAEGCGGGDGFSDPACGVGGFLACDAEPGTGPGLCYAEVTCADEMPQCPPDTQPGIAEGCWTGFCIPVSECEAEPTCAEIVAEGSCIARTDCAPLYRGEDCTCDMTGCTCASWTFVECSEA